MDITNRFQRAFETPVGFILVLLMVFVLLLGIAYWILLWRQKRKDLLAYLNQAHYAKAEALAKRFTFVGAPKADFFGRMSTVRMNGHSTQAVCTIPPPDVSDAVACDRFRCFHRAVASQTLPLFAPHLWKHDDDTCLVVVQGQLIASSGHPLLHLSHHLSDKKLGKAYMEQVLLELARALAQLHDLTGEMGDRLYHGFLLPRSLFIEFDANRTINHIIVADLGLAYAVGPERVNQRLQALRNGTLAIERFCGNELLEQQAALAPEQRDSARLQEVGPCSDYYSFGALAVTLFTRQRFASPEKIDWSMIPEPWHAFIKACLSDRPEHRPTDFSEIADWLADPELALTHRQGGVGLAPEMTEPVPLQDVSVMLQKLQARRSQSQAIQLSEKQQKKFSQAFEAGSKALKMGRWKVAREHFLEAVKIAPHHAGANMNLAVACYEMGDLPKAQKYHEIAKKIDPNASKGFHEHIAFRI